MPSHLIVAFVLFTTFTATSSNQRENNGCESRETCSECLQELSCVWCMNLINSSHCISVNNSNYCPRDQLVNPKSTLQIVQNNDLKSQEEKAIQIKPQLINLKARKGETIKVPFQYAQAENYPVDLYYIMDLSASMEVHRQKLAKLGRKIADAMTKITNNFKLGFGSFVDKTELPFVSTVPDRLIEPCKGCVAPYSFKNHMSLTEDYVKFSIEVGKARASGNLDVPEGGFDAIMQAIVCKDEIGWRPQARHLLVFSTDAPFHIAGDGRLAGIVEPNDGKCHMKNGSYTHGLVFDYPSVSQINWVAKENNVNIIFAVVKGKGRVYESLANSIKNSRTGMLSDDSENVVKLIEENYNKIVSSVVMTDDSGNDIEIKYTSTCPKLDAYGCTDVHVGEIVNFTAHITPLRCFSGSKKLRIKPEAINEYLEIQLTVQCECDCENPQDNTFKEKAPECNHNGSLQCGICKCNEGRFGTNCECDTQESQTNDINSCKASPNDTEVCSGFGTCKCGRCECSSPQLSGKYCQCDSNSCKRVGGEICSSRGSCSCGICECLAGWTGDACQCPDSEVSCLPQDGGEVCSGRGECVCGECKCREKSAGRYCEESGRNGQRCDELRHCVECQSFRDGKQICPINCNDFNVTFVDKIEENNLEDSAKICRTLDDDGCTLIFHYTLGRNDELTVVAEESRVCPEAPNVVAWILGVSGSIILAGIAMLLIWKVLTTIHDRREYAKFENERSKSKWNRNDNPLYKPSVSTFRNPVYGQRHRFSVQSK